MAWKNLKVSGPSAAPPVAAERSRVKPSRSRSARNSSMSASVECLPCASADKPRLHAELVEALLERRGVHHAGAHVGGDRFPDPRREQHEGRRDLAEIVHHGVGLLDEVDLHPAQQAFAEHIDLFHDPGQRQHRDVFVVRSLRDRRRDRSRNAAARARRRASPASDAPWCPRWCRGSRRPRRWSASTSLS